MASLIRSLLIVYFSALAVCLAASAPRLACWLYAFKRQKRLENPIQNRLAVLIPARNESACISALFDCIEAQSYPRELFDVHVIVADSSDETISLSLERGFTPHIVTEQHCKSDALDACIRSIWVNEIEYDAYIIIDADCALDGDFLLEMNNALASGADIICSSKAVKNYFYGNCKCSLSASCNGTIWTLLDTMGNKFKSAMGLPCFTVGTGLMLTSSFLRASGGWHYKRTLTEDVELMQEAAMSHAKFFYYEHAVLYMEEAQSLSETNKRRRRWLTGVVQCERIYKKATRQYCTLSERYYTSALNYIYGYIGTSVFFAIICTLSSLLCALLGVEQSYKLLLPALLAVCVIYASFLLMTALVLACDRRHIRLPLWRKLLLFFINPLFYVQYITIIGRALFFPSRSEIWEPIERVDFASADAKGE